MSAETPTPPPRGQRRFYDRELAGVYRTTLDGAFVDCNEAMARMLGYGSRAELLADPRQPLPFDDRPAALALLRAKRTVAGEEGWLRRRDGQPVAVVYSEQLRTEADGRELVEGTLIDVTRRRALPQGDRLLTALASGVAHRVTEPLAALVANLGFALETLSAASPVTVREGEVNRELDQALRDAKRGADALRGVVRDLAVFARPADDAQATADLSALVSRTMAVVAAELGERATVQTALDEGLRVPGGEARLGRCLLQLLLEASDAMADGARDHLLRVVVRREGDVVALVMEDSRQGPHRDTSFGQLQCHVLAAGLGGRLAIEALPARGRRLRLELPSFDCGPAPFDCGPASRAPRSG